MNFRIVLIATLISLTLVGCSSNQTKTKPTVESNRERLLNLAAKRNQEKAEKILKQKKFYPKNMSEKEVHNELINIQKNINAQNREEAKRRIKELEEINKEF